MKEVIEIAVMGYDVADSDAAGVLSNHTENIVKRTKEEIRIKYILDLKEFPEDSLADRFAKSFDDILSGPEVKIVVEVMGGLHPAYEFVRSCLLAGKSVVTSSKELVTAKGADLLVLVQRQGLNFLFEAGVGGSIPIIHPISQYLTANGVTEIDGTLNGATNLILTEMIRDQMDLGDALALTQELGYTEHNPAADVERMDARRKICISVPLTFGKHMCPDQVHMEGITKVTLADVGHTEVWGGMTRLISRVKVLENDQIHIMVCPIFVPRSNRLATVDDVFSDIQVRDDSIGDIVFYGKGAGKLPTASAVVTGVIDYVRHFGTCRYLFWDQAVPDYMRDYRKDTIALYVRAKSEDSAFALGQAEDLFGPVRQLVRKGTDKDEFAFVTEPLVEEDFLEKLKQLGEEGVKVLSTLHAGEF